jgi:hypothetical protein
MILLNLKPSLLSREYTNQRISVKDPSHKLSDTRISRNLKRDNTPRSLQNILSLRESRSNECLCSFLGHHRISLWHITIRYRILQCTRIRPYINSISRRQCIKPSTSRIPGRLNFFPPSIFLTDSSLATVSPNLAKTSKHIGNINDGVSILDLISGDQANFHGQNHQQP